MKISKQQLQEIVQKEVKTALREAKENVNSEWLKIFYLKNPKTYYINPGTINQGPRSLVGEVGPFKSKNEVLRYIKAFILDTMESEVD